MRQAHILAYGLDGPLAARLAERFHRPALVIAPTRTGDGCFETWGRCERIACSPLVEAYQPTSRVADSSAFVSWFSFILQILHVRAIDTLTRFGKFRRCNGKNWGSANHGDPHARQVRMGAR